MAAFYRRSIIRSGIGPAIVGLSAWCAAGSLAVLSSDAAASRVVALAPWWVALVAATLAALVPGWRARPMTATLALLSALPWLPIPLPAAALLWTGPLAWVPIAAAFFVAEGSRALVWAGRVCGAGAPARATALAAIGSLVIGLFAAWSADPRVPGGDEPHYLVITQSLLQDGDLQIENNHAARDYAAYFGGTINPDFLARGRDNAIYSIHAPGVSALVLPAFAIAGFRGAQATLILLFAITGALMWRSAWRLTGDLSAAWFAWASVAGSTTMAVLSFMVFPDAPGACAVAAGVWLLVSLRDSSARAMVAGSAALAALPWLHTRFSILAGAIGLAVMVMLLADGTRPWAARSRRAALFLLVPIASAIAWLSSFYLLYGTIDPRAPYGPNPELRSWIWGAVTGLFVDQQFGLMTYAPVLAVALLGGVMRAPREWRLLSALCITIVVIYTMTVASYWMWWAGVPGLPARFLTAAAPLLVVPLAVAWARSSPGGRTALLAMLMVSLGITAMILGTDRSAMAWNRRDAQAAWLEWLSPVVNLPRMWPSFFWNGESAFLRHAAVLAGLVAALGAATRLVLRRYAHDTAGARAVVAAAMLMGAMVVTEAGWAVTASVPLDPARAQLEVHAASGSGAPVWQVGQGVRRWDALAAPMRIRRDEAPLVDRPSPVVLALGNVPAGSYLLDVTSPQGLSGELSVRIGRSAAPLRRFVLASPASQSLPLQLPGGAAALLVEAPNADLARQWQVTLRPASPASPIDHLARGHAAYGDAEAFFLDENVFVEADGFWVRGGRTAQLVLSRGDAFPGRTRVLQLRNGGAANTVTIRSGAWQEVLPLGEWQERAVTLPAAGASGAWPLMITSASGFRPSERAGPDTRFLGVWIDMRRP